MEMKNSISWLSLCFFSLCPLCLCGSFSFAANPTLATILPRGGQRGSEVAVDAHQGQRLSVEIEGLRVAAGFFDPAITILDSKRFELASSDDCTLLGQDGCLSIVAPADGTYVIQVRESAYRGSPTSYYRL